MGMYRDLKLENIIIDKCGYGKLCDMGFARLVLGKSKTIVGTAEYMAPEMIDSPHAHDTAVDWWGLGVLTFELFTDQVPWNVPDVEDAWDRINAIRMCHPDQSAIPYDLLQANAPKRSERCCGVGRLTGSKWWQVEVSMSHTTKFISKLLQTQKRSRLGATDEMAVRNHRFFNGFEFKSLESKMLPSPYLPPAAHVEHDVKPPRPLTADFDDLLSNDLYADYVDDGSGWDDAF